jgi:Zn-dependent M28 family amino/carboxypeptidase
LPHLYLVAHYDSKSQRMPLAVRITLFMLAIIAGLILIILTWLDVPTVFYLPVGLLAIAAAFPLLFLDVGNTSPGAIDNASSVGLVLHLAEVLAQRRDWQDKLHLTILIPSAEELTLMGSVAYVTAHAEKLHQQERAGGLYVLNFDGVGIDGALYYVGHTRPSPDGARISLLARVRRACAELGLPLKRFGFVGALFDHIPFAQRGFDALSLIAVGGASRSVHTPADAVDQLHVRGFDQAGRVALRVIEQFLAVEHPMPAYESRHRDASITE